jgi:hypothetical protein
MIHIAGLSALFMLDLLLLLLNNLRVIAALAAAVHALCKSRPDDPEHAGWLQSTSSGAIC